jgi:hypothetical protein
MHDCRRTKQNLAELVFSDPAAGSESAAGPQPQRALAEIGNCPACLAEYQTLVAALRAYDQAAAAALPEESYWPGYEARLRAKLDASALLHQRGRLADWWAGLLATPMLPLTAVAGLILFLAISAVWLVRQKPGQPAGAPAGLQANTKPQPSPTAAPQDLIQQARQTEIPPVRPAVRTVKSRPSRQLHPSQLTPAPEANTPPAAVMATTLPMAEPAPRRFPAVELEASPVKQAEADYFEKAQLLLRSFRNARAAAADAAPNLAYEKQQAGRLVYDNILLRRAAEAKGDLPVETALNSLEPLLLDIANLPDQPSRDEVQVIRARMQKQEIIVTLQLVAVSRERFSPPAQ